MRAGLFGLVFAGLYYAVAFGILGLLKVKRERKFFIATLPLAVFAVVWIISAMVYNSWGGIIIAVMLLISAGLAGLIKRFI